MELRPFVETDGRAMQELQSRVWPLGAHPGGLGWLLATRQVGEHVVVATEEGQLVGWGALSPGEVAVTVAPGGAHVAEALLESLLERAGGSEIAIVVNDNDGTLRDVVSAAGFVPGEGASYGMWLDVAAASSLGVDGYMLRAVFPDEYGRRVEAHRSAWRPAALPFHPDHRPQIDEAATSSFDAEVYDRCRGTWLYTPELDLVAVAADGSFAATCLAWFDPATGVAELEPMGVHPDHRRRGLAGALCHEVATRVERFGGSEVFINAGPREDYPAPAAYTKAGFRTLRRGQRYLRPR